MTLMRKCYENILEGLHVMLLKGGIGWGVMGGVTYDVFEGIISSVIQGMMPGISRRE